MDQMIGFSVCPLFKKIREKEGRGSSLRSKNDSAYALIHKSFDLFHFSRQHGEIGIGCNCQYAVLLRGMENDFLSVLVYDTVKGLLHGSFILGAFIGLLCRL